jgi:hypothetical protein
MVYHWLVVWNMAFIFPYIGNNNPIWIIFFRGVETTNQITMVYQWNWRKNSDPYAGWMLVDIKLPTIIFLPPLFSYR